ncbi:MAG TPA: glycosyl hydrolase family 28 protein, partial [Methylomirabilota bacterium]|nr:glycosyl hydrolase family 28 protein [Methylomirabilota bacterium]
FSPGEYRSGRLELRDRVTIRLERDATLVASRADEDFGPREEPGRETFADRETRDFAFALLRGHGVRRVTLTGGGRIDGNRSARGGPKPIALKACRDVRIQDLTLVNAGSYAVSLLGCDDVEVEGLVIQNSYADGIDPDSCRNVRIQGCRIESRDDAIAIKASLALGARRATENVTVEGCHLTTHHNGLKLGTESSGDFRNVTLRDCTVVGKLHPWKGALSSGLALQSVDGGTLERVHIANIRLVDVYAPLFVRLGRRGLGQEQPAPGVLREIAITDVHATGASGSSSIMGLADRAVARVALRRVRVEARGDGKQELVTRHVPDRERAYPDAAWLGELPAYALYCRYVEHLAMEDIDLSVAMPDPRPAVIMESVRHLSLRRVRAMPPTGGGPPVRIVSPT